ncbi:MAG TPA: hypothetical protein VFO65_05895, partial [Acidimicrobiales bacterium]|nr:hypothetical protein [Acidimicrobiales bacterium]
VARLKQFFTTSGFEVHAPVRRTFSIGARQELFERFFDVTLDVKQEIIGTLVTPAEMPVAALPDEFRESVESVTFLPPPNLLGE